MSDIVTIISTVGFPIAACVIMGWFIKYTTDMNNKNLNQMRTEQLDQIKIMTDAVNNNTKVVQQLVDKLDLCEAIRERDDK